MRKTLIERAFDRTESARKTFAETTFDMTESARGLFDKTFLIGTLFTLDVLLNTLASNVPKFAKELEGMEMSVQLKLRDNSRGRILFMRGGKVSGKNGIYPNADVEMVFEDETIARRVMLGQMLGKTKEFVSAAKNMQLVLNGPDDKAMWFSSLLLKVFAFDVLYLGNYGTSMPNGEKRYVTGTNGGPMFVYVKDGKLIRFTPIDLDDDDAEPWTIKAQGKEFKPPKRMTVSPYSVASKSMVYSKDRILYPMKRVDFDPNGERNPQNRGISGYERISWEEATDIVASEIKRVRRTYGPGAVLFCRSSHHLWGSIGYFTSASFRFFNCIGATTMLQNPDSWEGWAWGAVHHMGSTPRRGGLEPYNTVEDCMQNAEMIVFWSSDPESTSGVYGAQDGTIRRGWVKDLKMNVVHIDPYCNATAAFMGGRWIAPRPATDAALALAIANVWFENDTYDHKFVEDRTLGIDEWKEYVLGEKDGVPKTPEWQEPITGVEARVVRALAEEWGRKKTYLAAGGIPGFGGACRTAYGTEWARAMVCLAAMQGFGKPGSNFGGLQYGTPLDSRAFFPGYADGGFSGDFNTGAGVNMYNRMPQSPSMSSERQMIPRLMLSDAILKGSTEAFSYDNFSVAGQFGKSRYPMPGHVGVKMCYRYGGSYYGTQPESNRFVEMYQSDGYEFVVNQSIWMEGEVRYADVILPACTNFERWDVGEAASCGGYIDKSFLQINHRLVHIQHKCIEPLGESKSDFDIYQAVANKMGMWQVFSEGNNEYDWVRRVYMATDVAKNVPWKTFLKKGYYVIPPLPENRRDKVAFNWFYEGRKRESPELIPLPSEYYGNYGEGLQTQSGRFEFACQSLKRFDPDDKERLPICTYIPSFEGAESELYKKYPLQMISPHSKYSYHTMNDGKGTGINDINEHRIKIDGYPYWVFRMNADDAAARGLKKGDLIEVYNDRGSVLCGLDTTERLPRGVVHSYEACADFRCLGIPGKSTEVNGCVNTLTSKRNLTKNSHGLSVNSCLVEARKWEGAENTWKSII